ncbi:helicase associated domain-containing protein, partial [Akkermansiaceae bacterium]|nr:helicase associated domain-containing protein [Akkermansiaceae bacterium]
TLKGKGKLSVDKIKRLDEIGFVWDPIEEIWEAYLQKLADYKDKNGDCLVPRSFEDKQLVTWVGTQRFSKKRGKLDPNKIKRLDEIGFVWDPIEELWEAQFRKILAYKKEHGDCLVPKTWQDKQLVAWVRTQRMSKKSGKLDPNRIKRLDEIGFVWDAIEEIWEINFQKLVAYKEEYGNCSVPNTWQDKQLANWAKRQRHLKGNGKLSVDKIKRLNEIGFVLDPFEEIWEINFQKLVAYKDKNGDCLVTRSWKDKQLFKWVAYQRRSKKRGKLDPNKIKRLDEIGFVLDPIEELWEAQFRKILAYKKEHGNCSAPRSFEDKQLGNWVLRQRKSKKSGKLDPNKIKRLNEIGFVWNPFEELWEAQFRKILAYKKEHGDCLVPQSFEDKQLATWVGTQRRSKKSGKLDPNKIKRLDEIGFVWEVKK